VQRTLAEGLSLTRRVRLHGHIALLLESMYGSRTAPIVDRRGIFEPLPHPRWLMFAIAIRAAISPQNRQFDR
jgi:hypothetical protein